MASKTTRTFSFGSKEASAVIRINCHTTSSYIDALWCAGVRMLTWARAWYDMQAAVTAIAALFGRDAEAKQHSNTMSWVGAGGSRHHVGRQESA